MRFVSTYILSNVLISSRREISNISNGFSYEIFVGSWFVLAFTFCTLPLLNIFHIFWVYLFNFDTIFFSEKKVKMVKA